MGALLHHRRRHAVDLAAHTGLRLSDLLRLSWSHVQEAAGAIILPTGTAATSSLGQLIEAKRRRTALTPVTASHE